MTLQRHSKVCAEMTELGFPSGRVDAAWIVKDQGDVESAVALMTAALGDQEDEHRPLLHGVIGHWRWHYLNDREAEEQLRAGMHAYGTARADLAHLLIATGRYIDGREILEEGVAENVLECILPLANLLSRDGDRHTSEILYRRAIELGDGHSAWNLAADLIEDGRAEEALELQWLAASLGDETAIAYLADEEPPK